MTWFDYAVVAFVGSLVVRASMRGLIKEVFSLVGLVLGVVVATGYSNKLGEILNREYDKIDPFGGPVSYFLLFVGIGLLAALLAMATTKAVHSAGLSLPNRIGGGLFGLGKGLLMVAVAVLLLDGLGATSGDWYQDAVTRPAIEPAVLLLRHRVPEQWSERSALGERAEALKEQAVRSARKMAEQAQDGGEDAADQASDWKAKASSWLDHFMESLFGKPDLAPAKEESESDPIGDLIKKNQ